MHSREKERIWRVKHDEGGSFKDFILVLSLENSFFMVVKGRLVKKVEKSESL